MRSLSLDRRFRHAATALLALLSLVACSDDGAPSSTRLCTSAIECSANAFCVNATCSEPSPATCAAGEPTCGPNFDCIGDQCVPPRCQVPEDCGASGLLCEADRCRQPCGADIDCLGDGQICSPQGTCLLAAICNPPCGARRYCNPETLRCLARGCTADDECTRGDICEAATCVRGCRDDPACGVGSICTASTCVPGCRNNLGCTQVEICVEGTCMLGCAEDDACGLGMICRAEVCGPGCRSTDDCPAPERCQAGFCSP